MHQVGYLQGSHQASTKHEILKRSSNLLQSPQQHKKKEILPLKLENLFSFWTLCEAHEFIF